MLNSTKSSIGVIGLAVMGANLARNFASNGYQTSVYNRTYSRTQELVTEHPDNLLGFEGLKGFVESLELPRKIILMVQSGEPVDDMIRQLLQYTDRHDTIIDCGNSNWKDTQKRQDQLKHKVHFVGCGVSGGSLGALHGPSIMPGGDPKVVDQLLPYLGHVAAEDFQLQPCVANIGHGAAGHFVKMVHNGIEYALMQSIAEVYDILRSKRINQKHIRNIFSKLNQGNLQSYLLDITEDILESKTEDGKDLLELVVAKAENKGTGGWTAISAIELGVSVPSLTSALFARYSSKYSRSLQVSKDNKISSIDQISDIVVDDLAKMLELSFLSCYLQGMDLIQKASDEFDWKVEIDDVLRVWEGGCIIRSQMISTLKSYLKLNEMTKHQFLTKYAEHVTKIKHFIVQIKVPIPVTNSSIDYLLTLITDSLPTNLIQAQRDYFGEHTYVRTDTGETVTGGWNKSNG
jgi:6-phosphogluconate dehydrogenase